jgi:Ankyrin repeats (many copies)
MAFKFSVFLLNIALTLSISQSLAMEKSGKYKDIFEAIKDRDVGAVKDFLQSGININHANSDGDTPLQDASWGGQ